MAGHSMGGTQGDEGFGIIAGTNGTIYAAGKYRDVANFDPGSGVYNLSSLGNYEIYIGKYDPSGNLLWVFSMGDTIVDFAYPIVADAAGNIYTAGAFDGTIDFDPGATVFNLTTAGLSDIFMIMLGETATGVLQNENSDHEIIVIPNPAYDFINAEFQDRIFDATFYDAMGRKILAVKNITSQKKIPPEGFSRGLYFLKLTTSRQTNISKLIIER